MSTDWRAWIRLQRRGLRAFTGIYLAMLLVGAASAVWAVVHGRMLQAACGGFVAGAGLGLSVSALWWRMANGWWELQEETAEARDQWAALYHRLAGERDLPSSRLPATTTEGPIP